MSIVNSELLRLARERMSKAAFAPPGVDPAAAAAPAGGDPMAAAAAAPAGGDPMAAQTAAPMDMSMGAAPAPAPAPAATPAAPQQAPQQKLKPEQMMQMIDYRLYNMQQQLTAIMNALGVQLPPEAIVLPPGSTSAPPAEAALPGGAGAPTPSPAPAGGDPAAAAQLPQDVYAGADPAQTGGAVPPIPPAKAAWWQVEEPKAASYIGHPVKRNDEEQPISLQVAADAAAALYKSLMKNAR